MGFSRQEYWSGVPSPSLKEGTSFSNLHESPLVVVYTLLYLICMNIAQDGVMNVERGKISIPCAVGLELLISVYQDSCYLIDRQT